MAYDLKEIQKAFFEDPRWSGVEEMILEYIQPLLDMTTIDTTKDGETVRAEIIGRKLAHGKLFEFLSQTKMRGHAKPHIINSPFR